MTLASWESVSVLCVVLFAYLLVEYRDRAIGTSQSNVWTPFRGWPLVGHLPFFLANRSRAYEHHVRLQEQRPMTVTLPGVRLIYLSSPEHLEYVQKTNFANYVKGDYQSDRFRDVLGHGIFASDGHLWTAQRKSTSHLFSVGLFRTVIADSVDEYVALLVQVLGKYADRGQEIALNQVFFRFTLDFFVKMVFGRRLGSLEADSPVPFADAFDFAQIRLNQRLTTPAWSLIERFTSTGKRMREAVKLMDDFSYSIIDEREHRDAGSKGEKEAHEIDLLGIYRQIRDENGQPMSRKGLRDVVLNLLIAGRDTTAQALSWLYFYLVSDPALLDRVRQEASDRLGDATVTWENHQSLVWSKALFYEALRLHPSVPKNGKIALSDDHIPNGPAVRKGDAVFWSEWALSRRVDIWGLDAKQYNPLRWIAQDGSFKQPSQWLFHSFNGGPRLCLGQQLATFEAVAVIVALARNFDMRFAPGYLETTPMTTGIVDAGRPTPLYGSTLTLPMAHPMRVHFARREQAGL